MVNREVFYDTVLVFDAEVIVSIDIRGYVQNATAICSNVLEQLYVEDVKLDVKHFVRLRYTILYVLTEVIVVPGQCTYYSRFHLRIQLD